MGGQVETHERYDTQGAADAESAYASALTAQAKTLAAAVNDELAVKGRPTLWIRAENSSNGGETATLLVCLTRQTASGRNVLGYLTRDITFSTDVLPAASRYGAPLEAFDTAGATHAEVRVITLSGGAVDLYTWAT